MAKYSLPLRLKPRSERSLPPIALFLNAHQTHFPTLDLPDYSALRRSASSCNSHRNSLSAWLTSSVYCEPNASRLAVWRGSARADEAYRDETVEQLRVVFDETVILRRGEALRQSLDLV